jgi:hypothetical protein
MNDTTLTDMTDFLARQDHRSRHVFIALLSGSLVLAAFLFAYGVLTTGEPGSVLARMWQPILFYPFWPPGGRYLMNPLDARNVARVANAGYVFVAGFGVAMIVSQASVALNQLGAMDAMGRGAWDGPERVIVAAVGLLTAFFGNAMSRMPTPRAPTQKPLLQQQYKRVMCWLMVLHGLAMAAAAAWLPSSLMNACIAALSVSAVVTIFGSMFVFSRALKA